MVLVLTLSQLCLKCSCISSEIKSSHKLLSSQGFWDVQVNSAAIFSLLKIKLEWSVVRYEKYLWWCYLIISKSKLKSVTECVGNKKWGSFGIMVAVKNSFTNTARFSLLTIYAWCYISTCFVKLHESFISGNIELYIHILWVIPRSFFMSKELFIHCHSTEIQHF